MLTKFALATGNLEGLPSWLYS